MQPEVAFPPRNANIHSQGNIQALQDTFVNIRETGNFVVNVATLPQAHALHSSAFEFPSGVDEFEAVGLEKEASQAVTAPRIKDAPIAMECIVNRIIPVGDMND